MSLTNPNKVVTEQRLNEYHNKILPYLGGMPEMVANKFSKGDLYSTEERMIGQWIDGKPIYQKTYTTTVPNSGSNSVIGVQNIDEVIKYEGVHISSTYQGPMNIVPADVNATIFMFFEKSTQNLYLYNSFAAYAGRTAHLTIQYTKTTDSPISIGSDTDYSTEEKIVGTWIDGKPIYQKTATFTTPSSSGLTSVNIIPGIPFSEIDTIINMTGCAKRNDNSSWLHFLGWEYQNNYAICNFVIDFSKNDQQLYFGLGSFVTNTNATITVQYTKTTD